MLLHHTASNLEQSAPNGCSICSTIVDLVRYKIDELDYYRRSGIAIIRSSEDPCDEDSLVLEILYFVDGKVEQKASRLRADLLLLPCHSKHFHFLFLFYLNTASGPRSVCSSWV